MATRKRHSPKQIVRIPVARRIRLLRPPSGSPNVVIVLLDDVGFSAFGGRWRCRPLSGWPGRVCATPGFTPQRCAPPPEC
jgi:hypothetical protein